MSHFTWADRIPFFGHQLFHVLYAILCGVLLIGVGVIASRALKAADSVLPAKGVGVKGFFEVFVEQVTKLADSVMGPKGRSTVPFFCFLFLYIWVQNLLGLIPGFLPSTENINTTAALGLLSFLVYNYCGFREHGLSYLKQYFGPVLIMAPLFLVIEILSHAFRPLSLGLRLFGNMKGDHLVIAIFLDMVPFVIPILFYFLGFFVCTLQAFIFTILSMVYVSLAVSHDH